MKGAIKATFLPGQLWRCQNDPSDLFNQSIPKILAFHMSIKSCMWFLPSYCIQQDWAIQKEISSTQKVERQQRRLSARKRYWTVLNKLKHWQETNRDDWDDCCQSCDWSVIMGWWFLLIDTNTSIIPSVWFIILTVEVYPLSILASYPKVCIIAWSLKICQIPTNENQKVSINTAIGIYKSEFNEF